MKILLTGKNGQVGFELQRTLAPLGEVHAIDIAECNLADENAIRRLVQALQPDLIVNPAAYTAVDKAESEPALAAAINTRAIAVFGEEAVKLGAWVIPEPERQAYQSPRGPGWPASRALSDAAARR